MQVKGIWSELHSAAKDFFLIVIKAKLPYILKKDASNALIFSTRFFLQEFKLQKLSALQKPLGTQPTGHIRVIAEAKAITWVFRKRAEVMLGEMQHLLCKLENSAALQQKSKKAPKSVSETRSPGKLDIWKISELSLWNKQCEKENILCCCRVYTVPKEFKVS